MAKSFHCDHCGEAVSPDEVRCPHCGRFFRAVRCPVCSYTGEGKEFVKGCPSCGYLADNRAGMSNHSRKKKDLLSNLSRAAAFGIIAVLAALFIYFLYLLVRT